VKGLFSRKKNKPTAEGPPDESDQIEEQDQDNVLKEDQGSNPSNMSYDQITVGTPKNKKILNSSIFSDSKKDDASSSLN